LIKSFWIMENNTNAAPKSKFVGINPVQVLLVLLTIMSFTSLYIISGIQASLAATLEDTITVGEGPIALAFNPSDDNLYVANFNSANVSIIDTSTNTIEDTITVGEGPIALAFNPSDDNLYVADFVSGNVSIIDTSTNTIEDTITVGEGPIALAFNPSDDNLYVATETAGDVSVIEP
jgi:YVTN family beta-propeller protein